jgi:hypothetical protein
VLEAIQSSSVRPVRRLSSRLKNEVRILKIEPIEYVDGVETAVQCTMSHISLDEDVKYDALSYVWGDLAELHDIFIDGHSFRVTSNLFKALSTLRKRKDTRRIWIDAICINQEDLPERSQQVSQMGKIFTSAKTVVCWLGESDHESRLSFQLLSVLNSCIPYRDLSARTILKLDYRLHWHGLYSLFHRDYWWRVWIIQEITLAFAQCKPITILCGSDSFSWSDLVNIQGNLATHHLSDIDIIAHGNLALIFLRVSIETRGPRALLVSPENSETPDLNQALLKHHFKQSTDPKDKIYSVLGLSTAANDPSFIIDYTKSVRQVFTDVI